MARSSFPADSFLVNNRQPTLFFSLSKSLCLQQTYQPHIIVILALTTTTNLKLKVLHASLLIRLGRNIEWLEESAVVRIILGFL